MARRLDEEETRELMELWARLERLKSGIGAHAIVVFTSEYGSQEQLNADRQARDLLNAAIEVRDRICALTYEPESTIIALRRQ